MLSRNRFKISPAFSCFLILGLLTVSFMGGKLCVLKYLMMSRGVFVDGKVVSTYRSTGRHPNYFVNYDFDYNGVTYHGQSEASDVWVHQTPMLSPLQTPTASQLRVCFLPSDPNINWPPDVGAENPLFGCFLLTLAFLSLAIFVGIKAILDLRGSRHEPEAGKGITERLVGFLAVTVCDIAGVGPRSRSYILGAPEDSQALWMAALKVFERPVYYFGSDGEYSYFRAGRFFYTRYKAQTSKIHLPQTFPLCKGKPYVVTQDMVPEY
jgi:hypothetical protein